MLNGTDKAKINLEKHGIRFSDAEFVLFDPLALSYKDDDSEGEQRHVSMGTDSLGRVLVIVYTFRGDRIRLISAHNSKGAKVL